MTRPSASRAATQNARDVTATFIRMAQNKRRLPGVPAYFAGAGSGIATGADVAGAGTTGGGSVTAGAALAGIFSFWPTLILVVDRLFSVMVALLVRTNCL